MKGCSKIRKQRNQGFRKEDISDWTSESNVKKQKENL